MRGPRIERPLALLGLGAGLLVICGVAVGLAWFKLEPGGAASRKPPVPRSELPSSEFDRSPDPAPTVPSAAFLGPLPRAAASWWEARGPARTVVDQVYLVPDLPTFLEAIGEWDARHFFPILIDDPAWTLPFLRVFRPSRVVRIPSRAKPEGREALWSAALHAVGRSWSHPGQADSDSQDGAKVPVGLGRTPPGLVLSEPDSSSLAGGVALAAGRFQPLVRFESGGAVGMTPDVVGRHGSGQRSGFSTVLSLAAARAFARRLEHRVGAVVRDYFRLGDACDFLTLAGDWPYRYLNDRESGHARGEAALDDLVGRILEPELANIGKSMERWAFAGRLLGDPAASVYRSMCALFLTPDSALLWNTYGGTEPWNYYGMNQAAEYLARVIPGPLRHRAGAEANLLNWHQLAAGSIDRTRLIFFNSSGEPKRFAIDGGPGRPADLPPSGPSSVVIIHSFSAADPTDPRTIAGRWLVLGAFSYLGAMNEPFLSAFRPPALEAQLLAAGVPLSAAVREGPAETFGQPWRLVYLGDPLYRLEMRTQTDDGGGRLEPSGWASPITKDPDRLTIVAHSNLPSRAPSAEPRSAGDPELLWCLDSAIAGSCRRGWTGGAASGGTLGPDWRPILGSIPRDRLDPRDRPIWDALVIDANLELGGEMDPAPWHERLASIPAAEWSPKVEAVLEYATTHRLALAARSQDFAKVIVIWDEAIRRAWPAGSQFPAQFTERVGAIAGSSGSLHTWRDSLKRAEPAIAANPSIRSALGVVSEERKRVEAQLAGKP